MEKSSGDNLFINRSSVTIAISKNHQNIMNQILYYYLRKTDLFVEGSSLINTTF
jgi:hypothetical protein